MSEPFSYDEFSSLVSQIQNSSSSEDLSLSSEVLQRLDSMTKYFYSKEIESKNNDEESQNAQNNLAIRTILESSYRLMNFYHQNLQQLANSFDVSYSPNAKEIIKEISQTLQIDPTLNLSQQILKKIQNNHENSHEDSNDNAVLSKSKLASVLNVSPNSTGDDIIAAIQNLKESINSQNDKTESELFEMPNSAMEKQIKNDILKERVAELEKLLRNERKEKFELSDKCSKLNLKVIDLERAAYDYEQTIEVQKAKLEDQNELSAPHQEGIFSLQSTIQALSKELELQSQDLSDLSKQKESLIKINEKQSSFINLLMKDAEKRSKPVTPETPIFDADQIYSNDLFDRILEITATISSSVVDHITDIIHDGYNQSDYDKVIDIVSALIEDIRGKQDQINKLQSNSNNDNDNSNDDLIYNESNGMKSLLSMNLAQKVMTALRNEVAFIERLANSKSDRTWIKPSDENDDFFRATLQEEVDKAHLFLEENCKGIIEDSNNENDAFESLSLSGDPLQLKESLKKYLDSYPALITEEGQALMNILRHAIAAVAILNRYGIEVKNTFQFQVNQLKSSLQTINELTDDNKELKETEEAAVQKYEDMKDIMRKTMNTLQSAYLQLANGNTVSFPTEINEENESEIVDEINDDIYLSQSTALKAILNAIDQIHQFEQVNDDEYQQSVESKLVEALNDLDELRNSRMNEIEELESRSFSLRDQAEKDIQRQKLALEKQKVAFENASDEIKQLKADIQILTDSLHESQKNYQELQERLNGSRISTREVQSPSLIERQVIIEPDNNNTVHSIDLSTPNNNNVASQDMKKEIRKIEKKFQRSLVAIHVQEKEKRKGIKQKLHKLRDENESLINQLSEKDRQIKILETTQEQLLADHKSRSSKLRESEIQEQKNVSRLKAQVNELSMKLATTEMARKVADQQLRSLEEKALRRENDTKSIQEILKQEYSTRLEERANSIRDEYNNKHNDFVKQVVQEFRTCFDILPTIASSPNKISISPNKGQFVIAADLNNTNAAALEEVAMKLVKTASESIKYYSTEKKKNKKQLKELQNLFSVPSPIPSEITKAATAYVNNTKSQIESLQKQLQSKNKNTFSILDASPASAVLPATSSKVMSVKDWENWARKLYTWSNKGQSLLLSIQAVMRSVEETILEASGSNKVSRNNEILKIEKVILLQNTKELLFPSNAGHTALMPTCLSSICDILFFVRRIQMLSGTLPSNLALNTNSSTNLSSDIVPNLSPQPYSWNKREEKESPIEIDGAKKQQIDDYDFKEEQEIQQKLQQIQKQEDLANDEAEVAAIDLPIEEEEEVEEGQEPQPQQEHGEEQ